MTWLCCRQEEELYRGMISGLEERQQQLVVENTELRQCLRFMQQELNATLAHTSPTNVTQLSKSEVRFHHAGIIAGITYMY